MMRRPGLWLKILLVAFLNVALLLTVFFIFLRLQLRLDLGSFLLAPARYRMLSISRLAALEFGNMQRQRWGDLLTQYSSSYPAQFFLFDREGGQIAGQDVHVPPSLFQHHQFGPEHEGPGPPGPPRTDEGPHGPPREFREPSFPINFEHTTNPPHYWASVRVPVNVDPGHPPMDWRLVWRFDSLWTNPFFFDYKPWLLTVILIAAVSIACWLPLIRSLTLAITALTAATGQIAEGHFEVQVPVKRRDELGRLSESINQMANRLSGYVNGQRRFLGDIAHELCSPVARIQLSLGILGQRASDAARPYVETIDEEVQHMSTLVNELLSFSKASIGASTALESVNIGEAVGRAVEREKTGDVTIQVDVPPSLAAVAQPDYLFRSVSNVLRNAIRYAGGDGPIEISAREVGGFAVISVTDHGPGVAPAELVEILKPFYRPETARQRETGGVGLGLAIVRSCMEACGGTVTCRNRMPRGFEVDLRLRAADAKL
jgi:two-component system sensor histidine kinase CpxA